MKRRMFCLLMLLCLICSSTALANSWGAPGDTVDLFDGTDYNDYSVTAEDYSRKRDTLHLVVNTRYHQQLLVAEKSDKAWKIVNRSTKAVWQPGDDQVDTKWPETKQDDKGFTLLYEDESYRFEDAQLVKAEYGNVSCTLQGDGYLISDGTFSAVWMIEPLYVENFNIRLMPRTAEEVARMNRLCAMTRDMFSAREMPASNEKSAVYSAPTKESWRANKGEAYVSLRDPEGLYRFGIVENGWELIQYQVSLRTSRIGYIQAPEAQADLAFVQGWHMIPVVAAKDTYFTDDPGVSQYQQGAIPAGKTMVLLGRWDDYYAYAAFSHEGQLTRGFIPLRDLEAQEYTSQLASAQLQGTYTCLRGGNTLSDAVTFYYDGTFTQADGNTGAWDITSGDQLSLTLNYDKDASETMQIVIYSEGFSLYGQGTGAGDYLQK